MKKSVIYLALALLCLLFAMVFVSCDDKDNTPPVCQHCDADDNALCDKCGESYTAAADNAIGFKTLTVNGTNVYGKVSNKTTVYSFFGEVSINGNATFEVYRDAACTEIVGGELPELACGDNLFYIREYIGGAEGKLYTVTIYRKHLYTVSFDTAGGTPISSQTVEEGGLAQAPADPERSDYTFKGWAYDFTTPVTGDITIVANWQGNRYVTFVTNGGDAIAAQTLKYGDPLPTPVRTGYTFGGWFADVALTAMVTTAPANSITVYAYWAEENKPGDFLYSEWYRHNTIRGYQASGTGVVIPAYIGGKPVTSIDWYAFKECTGLTSVTIPASVTSIEFGAFYDCTGLTSITISEGVTSVGYFAFYGCTGLTSITIPASVTSIGDNAFEGCTGLTSITIPASVTSIGENAFEGCTGLTSIIISEGVTSIGSSAFSGCTGLQSVTFGENSQLKSIGSYAFSGCTDLTSITIPASVTSIGSSAFYGCTDLTSITVDSGNTVYHSAGNCLIETVSKTLVTGCKNSVIPTDGRVTSIRSSAFEGCTGLTSITIPASVTSIGSSAFRGCTDLTSITIPASVTSIGSSAFFGCTDLTSITIPASVTSIGSSAFSGCTGLQMVTFENTAGWWYAYDSTATSGTAISATDLQNAGTAADYLTWDYDFYYWKRG